MKRIVVEIGEEEYPLLKKIEKGEFSLNGKFYVGLNIPAKKRVEQLENILSRLVRSKYFTLRKKEDMLQIVRSKIDKTALMEKKLKETPQIYFVKTTTEKLPFRDESIDEIHLHNIFNDPAISKKTKKRVVKEIKRCLRKEGLVVASGDYAPPTNKNSDKFLKPYFKPTNNLEKIKELESTFSNIPNLKIYEKK